MVWREGKKTQGSRQCGAIEIEAPQLVLFRGFSRGSEVVGQCQHHHHHSLMSDSKPEVAAGRKVGEGGAGEKGAHGGDGGGGGAEGTMRAVRFRPCIDLHEGKVCVRCLRPKSVSLSSTMKIPSPIPPYLEDAAGRWISKVKPAR